jgi:hypothetical protein
MDKYKPVMRDLDYLYWRTLIIEVISDEIDGYIKHQYSRVPSSSTFTFSKFVQNEFNELIVPVCERFVKGSANKLKRRSIIDQSNEELSKQTCSAKMQHTAKVVINEDANRFY